MYPARRCRVFPKVRLDSDQARYTGLGDRYEISRELGRGGMAVVYLARQTDLDRWVALKELHPEPRDASVVHALPARVAAGRLALAPEHRHRARLLRARGRRLHRDGVRPARVAAALRRARSRFAQTAGVLEGILAALTCAEHGGIVHRDLKPENVMITWDGRVKLTDFGIAKATGAASLLTATGTTLGTPHYMAPEQAMAQQVGPWTDLYSVGCMAYELVTGQLPFADTEAPMAVLLRHVNDVPVPAASVDPASTRACRTGSTGCWPRTRRARPRSAAEAWEALEEIVLALEGPRWRRHGALPAIDGSGEVPGPFTPPPSTAVPESSVFKTFDPPPSLDLLGADADQRRHSSARRRHGRARRIAPRRRRLRRASRRRPPPARGRRRRRNPRLTLPPRTPAPRRARSPAGGRRRAGWAPSAALAGGRRRRGRASRRRRRPSRRVSAPSVAPPVPLEAGAGASSRCPRAGVSSRCRSRSPACGSRTAAPRRRETGGAVLAGLASRAAHTPALLPDELLDALGLREGVVPEREAVRLGGLAAYRYEGLRPRGLRRAMTVYAAPTTAGVATLACVAPLAPADCAKAAAEPARRRGDRASRSGRTAAFGDAVERILARLARELRAHGDALRGARSARGQAAAAQRIAADHRAAAPPRRGCGRARPTSAPSTRSSARRAAPAAPTPTSPPPRAPSGRSATARPPRRARAAAAAPRRRGWTRSTPRATRTCPARGRAPSRRCAARAPRRHRRPPRPHRPWPTTPVPA